MKRSDAFPTKYLSKDDIKMPTIGVIENVINETLGSGDDQEIKPVMYFKSGIDKPMVINATNWLNVESVYGEDSDNWIGKMIEVWVDPAVAFGGKRIGGLRLREPAQRKVTTTASTSENGNGKSRREKLIERYDALTTEAEAAGVDWKPQPINDMTDEQIVEAGKALKAAIESVNEPPF